MRALLSLAAAALAAVSSPAFAAEPTAFGQAGFDQPFGAPLLDRPRLSVVVDDRRGRDDRRRHRGGLFVYDRDYQGDTAWRSDSFNDWWHDRPDRAYPRWMQDNRQTCDRQWYAGDLLRC